MANTILLKKNSTANAAPTASQLSPGELAINTADGRLFAKNAAGTVVNLPVTSISGQTITPGTVGVGNVSPAAKLHVTGLSNSAATPIQIVESTGSDIPVFFRYNNGSTFFDTAVIRSDSASNLVLAADNDFYLGCGGFTDWFLSASNSLQTVTLHKPVVFQDETSGIKSVALNLTGLTAYSPRTLTVPDANGTIALTNHVHNDTDISVTASSSYLNATPATGDLAAYLNAVNSSFNTRLRYSAVNTFADLPVTNQNENTVYCVSDIPIAYRYSASTYSPLSTGHHFLEFGTSSVSASIGSPQYKGGGIWLWTVPSNVKCLQIISAAAGGGGGSGRKGAGLSGGGGGGGAGEVKCVTIPANNLEASALYIRVGYGGAGGSGVSTSSSNGNTGTTGGSTFVRYNNNSTLLSWELTNVTGSTGSGTATTINGAYITGSALTAGPGTTLGSTGTNLTGSPSNTWNRTYGALQTTATASLTAGCYIEWTTTVASQYTAIFSGITGLTLARNTAGPTTAALFYSTNGGTTFQQTGSSFSVPDTTPGPAWSYFSTSMANTPIVLSGINGTASIIWRVVFFGSGSSRAGIGSISTPDMTMVGAVRAISAGNGSNAPITGAVTDLIRTSGGSGGNPGTDVGGGAGVGCSSNSFIPGVPPLSGAGGNGSGSFTYGEITNVSAAAPTGGGGGGGISVGGVADFGAYAQIPYQSGGHYMRALGGSVTGGSGATGFSYLPGLLIPVGSGGGGGAASVTVGITSGYGGQGGFPGGGGGGGGALSNSVTGSSGDGGAGADGFCKIILWF
jgi:hypothetical protein